MEQMPQTSDACHRDAMAHTWTDLKGYVDRAAQQGIAAHEVEAGIWRRVLQLGHQALELLCALVGPGDVGEAVVLPDGRAVRRLATTHPRGYPSVCGRLEVERGVYGTRAGQQLDSVPVDTQLQWPESDFSYLLQAWAQSFAVENTSRRVPEALGRILAVPPSVESRERMNQKMA